MALYIVESHDYLVDHGGKRSEGVIGSGMSSEKVYLHVIDIEEHDVARLAAMTDDFGNRDHERLARPNDDEWWVAVQGELSWPKTVRPRLTSHCELDEHGVPRPCPLTDAEISQLRTLGVPL